MHRRDFLLFAGAAAGSAGLASLLGGPLLASSAQGQPSALAEQAKGFVSGVFDRTIAAGQPGYGAAAVSATGELLWRTHLPDRSHGSARHPDGRHVCVFARRPGDYFAVLDAKTGHVRHQIAPAKGRVFQGHGCYSPDGRWLYTSENAFEAGHGVIGVYATDTYTRVREFAAGGIGPHECLTLGPDLMAVAIGGIKTHPDFPREKLNLPTMQSSVVWLKPTSQGKGTIVGRASLPKGLQQLSLRHLAVHGDQLAIAAQHQQKDTTVPLLFVATIPSAQEKSRTAPTSSFPAVVSLKAVPLPATILSTMKGYCGSVAFSADGAWLYGSSPKGGVMVAYHLATGASASMPLKDGCGVASASSQTVFSSGSGRFISHVPNTAHPLPSALAQQNLNAKKEGSSTHASTSTNLPLHFDNHITAL